ncbi:hypothetical protein GNZ18_18260 [Actinomadura sp. NEAU-AAG5]|uniref:Ricin B lectin domain-containing protein n=2 Tax=Actinomadura litoris TaxID=2678616 RepID=A0A7K1L262_9ACTN|nr:hypothetical protein [Actinomadura litoris]
MKRIRRRMLKKALLLGFLTPVSFVLLGAAGQTGAYADGKFTWKNIYVNRHLEVYSSSKANGAYVGTWPWNGTATQYWYASKQSDGYFRMDNYNSWKALDRWDSGSCDATQWSWWGGSQQRWKVLQNNNWTKEYGTLYELINKKGCRGDAYHDHLAANQNRNIYQAYLWPDSVCGGGRQFLDTKCFWK